jgi:hypothetical protein
MTCEYPIEMRRYPKLESSALQHADQEDAARWHEFWAQAGAQAVKVSARARGAQHECC